MNDNEQETVQELPENPADVDTDQPDTPEAAEPDVPESEADTVLTPEPDETGTDAENGEADTGTDTENENNEADAGMDTETGEETDTGEEGDGTVTNVTIVRPPVQITYQADTEASYHVIVENEPDMPVPVVITETLAETEHEPGIMEKRLEDYTVTEGLLLCILIVLILRMIFDYGRRLF